MTSASLLRYPPPSSTLVSYQWIFDLAKLINLKIELIKIDAFGAFFQPFIFKCHNSGEVLFVFLFSIKIFPKKNTFLFYQSIPFHIKFVILI